MSSGKMTNSSADMALGTAARVAGVMFLFSLVVPSLKWALVLSKLIVKDNVMATAKNIVTYESLFRIGISIELIMAVGLVVLAVALYAILRTVNKSLALIALLLKLVEATIVAVIVLVYFVAMQILDGAAYLTRLRQNSRRALSDYFSTPIQPFLLSPWCFLVWT